MTQQLNDLTDKQFGELTVVCRCGTRNFKRKGTRATRPMWRLRCPKGHECERSTPSLRISGDSAKCQECHGNRTLRRYQELKPTGLSRAEMAAQLGVREKHIYWLEAKIRKMEQSGKA